MNVGDVVKVLSVKGQPLGVIKGSPYEDGRRPEYKGTWNVSYYTEEPYYGLGRQIFDWGLKPKMRPMIVMKLHKEKDLELMTEDDLDQTR